MGFTTLLPSALIHAPLAFAVVDRTGRVQEANQAFHALLGNAGEVEKRPLAEVLGCDPASFEPDWQAIAAGERNEATLGLSRPLGDGGRSVRLRAWPLAKRGTRTPPLLVELEVQLDAQLDTSAPDRTGGRRWARELDRISDGLVVFDRDWRVLYVNAATASYFQLPVEQMIGKVYWEVFPQLKGTELELKLRRAATAGRSTEFELRTPMLHRWVAVRAFPSEQGLTISFRDHTAQKRAMEALRTGEAKYRSLFEHSLEGVLLTRPDGTILAANPAACALLGRSEAELCAAGRSGVIAPEEQRLEDVLDERRRTGKVRAELLMVRKDGTRFPAELASSVFKGSDGQELTSLIFHDLTARKRAQSSLEFLVRAGQELGRSLDYEKTLEALSRLVVPEMADLCMVDLVEGTETRRVALAHRDPGQAAKLRDRRFSLGTFYPQVGIARVIQTQQPELMREVTEEWIQEAIRDPSHQEAALDIRPVSVMHVPLVDHGQTLGAITLALVRDNPRRFTPEDLPLAQGLADRAAQAINHARLFASAVEAKQVRDDVLAVVSHDLRSPLYTISLCTEILSRRQPHPQLEVIRSSIHRAERLIDDLLVASALESGALPLERDLEPVGAIVQEAIKLHRAAAEDRSIEIATELEEELPRVPLDRHRILQLLGNLVGNAIKFTPKGGQVVVAARRTEGELELSVRDTGPGIGPEDLPHVFDRFWKGSKNRRAGMGLGLAIAKGIADSHGGRIHVESAPGAGSRFVVRLPLAAELAQVADLS